MSVESLVFVCFLVIECILIDQLLLNLLFGGIIHLILVLIVKDVIYEIFDTYVFILSTTDPTSCAFDKSDLEERFVKFFPKILDKLWEDINLLVSDDNYLGHYCWYSIIVFLSAYFYFVVRVREYNIFISNKVY